MTDIIDRAAEEEAIFLAEALYKARSADGGHKVSLTHCEDCGEPIPTARQQAVPGCTRCVLCQQYVEVGWQ